MVPHLLCAMMIISLEIPFSYSFTIHHGGFPHRNPCNLRRTYNHHPWNPTATFVTQLHQVQNDGQQQQEHHQQQEPEQHGKTTKSLSELLRPSENAKTHQMSGTDLGE